MPFKEGDERGLVTRYQDTKNIHLPDQMGH